MTTLPPRLQLLVPLKDEELVARIVEGDSAAFELLMRRHNQRLFRLARSIVRDDDEAEEIVQETYLRAYAGLAGFEGRSSVITWLCHIAFHEALRRKRLRQRGAAQGLDLDAIAHDGPAENAPDMIQAELKAALARAVDALPEALRAVVMLRLVEGLSTRATAESLRVSESYVKVTLHRARHLLQARLERHSLAEIRHAFSFGEARCDRVVASVYQRLFPAMFN